MDLYNTIYAILKRNDGKISFDELFELLRDKYSKDSVKDFIIKNDNLFQKEEKYLVSYQAKIDRWLDLYKSDIHKYSLTPKVASLIFLSHFIHSTGSKEHLELLEDADFTQQSHFDYDIQISTDPYYDLDKEFINTPIKKYLFSHQLFEFLIANEQINSGIYSTPQTIIELISKFLPDKQKINVYNPAAGFLNLATALQVYSGTKLKIKASELLKNIHYFGRVLSAINSVDVDFSCTDSGDEITQLENSSFDFIVSNLPFAVKDHDFIYKKRRYKEFSMHIITESLHKLKDSGRAVFLVNDGILFSGQKEEIAFRREIITSGTLNCIISLPAGILSQTNVKSSLLVFEKGKHKDHVQLINAAEKKFYSLRPDKSVFLNTDKISSLITWEESGLAQYEVHEQETEYGERKAKINVSIDELEENGFTLSAGRYIAVKEQYQGEDYITLKEVCHYIKAVKADKKGLYPFIRITELNGQILSEINNSFFNNTLNKGRIIKESVILVGTIKGSYKPTWFTGDKTIEVSNNIAVLGFNSNRVYPPYLVQELGAEYVTEQFNLLAKGSAINSLTREDLLSVKVKLPSIEEQKRIYNERISFETEHHFTQVKSDSTISDAEIFKVMKHEIGNILRRPEGFLNMLPDFLLKNNVGLDSPFVSGHPETIGEMVNVSIKKLNQIHWLMENLKGILFADKKYFKPELTELKSFVEKCLENEIQNNEMQWHVVIDGEYTNKHKYFAEIDRLQFENVVRNMVVNAITHGKNENILRFVVNIMSFEEFDKSDNSIMIDFINDGNPLPVDFSIEDFTQFGKKTGASNGHGLGGYLINQVVNNHNGFVEIMPPGQNIEVEKSKIVSNRVHFEITIPKNQ